MKTKPTAFSNYYSIFCVLVFFISFINVGNTQEKIELTNQVDIVGLVEKNSSISLSDLKKYKNVAIPDVIITNHKGDFRKELTKLKGIPLKEILKNVTIKAENPKVLSEYYFVFEASDGYKVVYSWNELYNSPVGDHVFLITCKDEVTIENMDDRILVVNTLDTNTGRRHIKSLNKIIVKRIA